MPIVIPLTADSTVTADSVEYTADGGIAPKVTLPGQHPKYIAGGAGGFGSILFGKIDITARELSRPKRLHARLVIDPATA